MRTKAEAKRGIISRNTVGAIQEANRLAWEELKIFRNVVSKEIARVESTSGVVVKVSKKKSTVAPGKKVKTLRHAAV